MLDSLTQLIVRAAADMTPEMLLGCFAALFVGAVIRGFTGFGSSLVWVPSLSLILPPVAVIPVVYMLEFGASAHLLPRVRYEADRSEEHTSELQSLMRISYAVFCLKKKTK